MVDVRRLRKALWLIIPMFTGIIYLSWWITLTTIYSVEEIVQNAPTIRIWPAGIIGPFAIIFFGICLVLAVVRSTYYEGAITKALDRLLIISGVIQIALLMTVLTMSTLIQDQVMPKLGYSNCALLQGNPTLWFTDWIKNPEWCVHGKDRQWVHGQAKAAPPK